jgi:putative transposase
MHYRFFDPLADTTVGGGHLPHWEQENAYYFLTFRTADSLPAGVHAEWLADRHRWLRSHGIDPAAEDCSARVEHLPDAQRWEFASRFGRFWQRQLDACHGECQLREPTLRRMVAQSVLFFEGQRYSLVAFVIMPNHVHVLAGVNGRGALRDNCRSWKHFSATRINRELGRAGRVWQSESYDHLVRTPESLARFRDYIIANPRKAALAPDEYTLYVSDAPLPAD